MFGTTLITPRDALVPTGSRPTLEVEVERGLLPFLDPAMPGTAVEIEGAGRGLTDAAGLARITAESAPPAGFTSLSARLPGSRSSAELIVKAVPSDEPIFVTDLDMTAAHVSPLGFIFRDNASIPPMEGAPEALRQIARTMTVLYVTARDHIFLAKTRAWLRMHGFPEGPVMPRRQRFWSKSSRAHKTELLAGLRRTFTNFRWGVGDARGDLEAYAANAVPPILLSASPRRRRRAMALGAAAVPDWQALLQLIK